MSMNHCVFLFLTTFFNFCAAKIALHSSVCTVHTFYSTILGSILLDFLFCIASHLISQVSFIPFHVPLNLHRRNKNSPFQRFQPTLYTIFSSFLVFADIDILIICFTNSPILDDLTCESIILLLNLAKSLPSIGHLVWFSIPKPVSENLGKNLEI